MLYIIFVTFIIGAVEMWLMGDFNHWEKHQHSFKKLEFGRWELQLPPTPQGECPIPHMSRIKLVIKSSNGEVLERLDPWASYVLPTPENIYIQHFWNPPKDQVYTMKASRPPRPENLKVYECHVGISSSEGKVNTYQDFAQNVLPRHSALKLEKVQKTIICIFKNGKKSIFAPEKCLKLPKMQFSD